MESPSALPSALTGVMDYSHVCQLCEQFISSDVSDELKWGGAEFMHYSTGTELKTSAQGRCHLCILLVQALENSRRPTTDTELPERQILLRYLAPTLEHEYFQIDVHVQPESVATAGKHDHGALTDVTTSQGYGQEFREAGPRIAAYCKSMTGEDQLWISWIEDVPTYFINTAEVSADAYFAKALPYYHGSLVLQVVNNSVDEVLRWSNRLVDSSTDSTSTRAMALLWLHYCLGGHLKCQSYQSVEATLPTRVVDVGDKEETQVPYLFVPHEPTQAKYLTLSHCWGGSRDFITTTNNIEVMRAGFRLPDIPKTFADAVQITRELGFRYLWIDSLCIVQDCPDDWRSESAKMGAYYRSSVMTIAAADSVDTHSGCFRERDGLKHKPCTIWASALASICGGVPKAVYAFNKDPVWHKSSLVSRGWVLQEELLSARTLFYGKNGISWRCVTTECAEHIPHAVNGRPPEETLHDVRYLDTYKLGIIGYDGADLHKVWPRIVEDFSRRKLSFEKDRLIAISGIATEFAQATGDQYLAGIWRRNLWRGLTWSVCAPGSPLFGGSTSQYGPPGRRPDAFTAPSWSWAGVAGNIKYFHLFPEENDEDLKTNLKVLECKADPSEPSTISSTYSGTLQLQGVFQEAEPCLWDDKLEYPLIQWGTPVFTKDVPEEYNGKLRALNELLGNGFPFATREVSTAQLGDFGIPNIPKPSKVASDDDNDDDGFSTMDYTLADSAGEGSLNNIIADRLDAAGEPVKGHSLRDPVSGVQVGFWAPDIIEADQAQECKPNPITFLALCKKTEYVFALGIVPVAPGSKQYRRVGLGIWNWLAFYCSGGKPKEGTFEIV